MADGTAAKWDREPVRVVKGVPTFPNHFSSHSFPKLKKKKEVQYSRGLGAERYTSGDILPLNQPQEDSRRERVVENTGRTFSKQQSREKYFFFFFFRSIPSTGWEKPQADRRQEKNPAWLDTKST